MRVSMCMLIVQVERQPIACANAALSESNWQEAVRVPSLLGLDPRAADLLNSVVGNGERMLSCWRVQSRSGEHLWPVEHLWHIEHLWPVTVWAACLVV